MKINDSSVYLQNCFSFIFKDDQPVEKIEDPEVVNNPQEPIRIEEKVRKKKKKKHKKRRPDFSNRKVTRKEVNSKIGSKEKTHRLENIPRIPPKPYRKKQIEAETLVLDLRKYFNDID